MGFPSKHVRVLDKNDCAHVFQSIFRSTVPAYLINVFTFLPLHHKLDARSSTHIGRGVALGTRRTSRTSRSPTCAALSARSLAGDCECRARAWPRPGSPLWPPWRACPPSTLPRTLPAARARRLAAACVRIARRDGSEHGRQRVRQQLLGLRASEQRAEVREHACFESRR